MSGRPQRVSFTGGQGFELSARLDLPAGHVRAYALFAHCFTCSSQTLAAKYIAAELAKLNIAVLRFDFTGLGSSGGEFANTNFSSNIQDLVAAADYLRDRFFAPTLLIGHSLGGAAVLAAADKMPEVKAVVTIGAPSDADHVLKNFSGSLGQIEQDGEARVSLAGRHFTIQKQFVDDLKASRINAQIAALHRDLLILHSPFDEVVGIENATRIFVAAKHPKSFVSLDKADHLLNNPQDAIYAAGIIHSWASRHIRPSLQSLRPAAESVVVSETRAGKYQNTVASGQHLLLADEPVNVGGLDSGPSPYEYLSAALGACTSMTIRMYVDLKKIELGAVTVEVSHSKVHADDSLDHVDSKRKAGRRLDRFERLIFVDGEVSDELEKKLLIIANKCPVHKTLTGKIEVVTSLTRAMRRSEEANK